jgi:hypothetical protein
VDFRKWNADSQYLRQLGISRRLRNRVKSTEAGNLKKNGKMAWLVWRNVLFSNRGAIFCKSVKISTIGFSLEKLMFGETITLLD